MDAPPVLHHRWRVGWTAASQQEERRESEAEVSGLVSAGESIVGGRVGGGGGEGAGQLSMSKFAICQL